MTATELKDILSKINLQSLSDEELAEFHAIFSVKEAEASWIIRGREHLKTHSKKDAR